MERINTQGRIDGDEATKGAVIAKKGRVDSTKVLNDVKATATSPENAKKTLTVTASSTAPLQIPSSFPIPSDEYAFVTPPHFSSSNPLHKSLFSLDASFRCSICGEIYVAPVAVLPCLHTFCSECVRRHCKWGMGGMKRECRCPECNQLIGTRKGQNDYENAILPNHHFENQLDIYKQMREGLLSSFVRLDVLEKEKMGKESSEPSNGQIHEHCGEDNSESKRKYDIKEKRERAPKRACRNIAKTITYAHSSDSDNDDDSDYESFRTHSHSSKKPKPKITLQRKTVVSYHGMKRKKLAELCNKEGLPSHGTDEELKRRHSDYITLYNSECDSDHPRSVAELLKEINKRETERKREATRAIQNGSQRHESYMNKLK
ncbi:hypothetical protein ACHAW6_013174 [Cyclotella cf. meneghiniana]